MSNKGENTHKQLQYRKLHILFLLFTYKMTNMEYDKNG